MSAPLAWIGQGCLIAFLFANIETARLGVGYPYLGLALACGVLLVVLQTRPADALVLRRSMLPLFALLTYFVAKLAIDIGDLTGAKAYLVGTSEGVLFAYLVGVLSAMFSAVLFRRGSAWTALFHGAFLLVCVLLAIDAFATHWASLRRDLFLIEGADITYQRAGNFAIMATMIASVHVAQASVAARTLPERLIVLVCVGLYVALTGLVLVTTQMFGSNMGFGASLGLVLGTLVWLSRPDLTWFRLRRMLRGEHSALLPALRRSAPRLVLGGAIVATTAIGAGLAFLSYAKITIRQLRVFGFSEGRFGGESLASRFEILFANAYEQFAYNPIFGNLSVDALTTGRGTYAHSLASIATHLGVVGACLFIAYAVVLGRELYASDSSGSSYYRNLELALFRTFALAVVIVFAAIGAFFTWMPLWFAFGLLHPGLILVERSSAFDKLERENPGHVFDEGSPG